MLFLVTTLLLISLSLGSGSRTRSGLTPPIELSLRDPLTNATCLLMEFGTLQYRVQEYGFNAPFAYPPMNSEMAKITLIVDNSTSSEHPISACPTLQNEGEGEGEYMTATLSLLITFTEQESQDPWTCTGFLPSFEAGACPFGAGSDWRGVSQVVLSFVFTGKPSLEGEAGGSLLPVEHWETTFIYHSVSFGRCENRTEAGAQRDSEASIRLSSGECSGIGPTGPISDSQGLAAFQSRTGYGLACNRTVTLGWPEPAAEGEYIWIAELSDFNMQPFNVNGTTEISPAALETCPDENKRINHKPMILGLGVAVAGMSLGCVALVAFIIYRKKKEHSGYERLGDSSDA